MPTTTPAACPAPGMSARTDCGASAGNSGSLDEGGPTGPPSWYRREGFHAPHRERQSGGYADHLDRSRAGQAARSAIVDDGASAFHGAATGLYLDQPAPKPRWAAQRQLHPVAKSRTAAGGSQIAGLSQGLAQVRRFDRSNRSASL